MKNVLICFIGTNKYINFFDKYYETAKKNFLTDCNKTFVVFTDQQVQYSEDVHVINIEHMNWPYVTLLRFKTIKKAEELIKKNDWFIYVDADMYFNSQVKYNDFFDDSKPLFGVRHPGYLDRIGTFEFNKNSTAYVNPLIDDTSTYWQGCIWGGKSKAVIKMIDALDKNVNRDLERDIIALWHDESHMNRFFITYKDKVHTLDSGFAYPETWNIPFQKKIIHAHKDNKDLHT